MKLLVTGGAGFIGSAFIRFAIQRCTDIELVNLDKLSYAGNLENLAPIASNDKYRFVHADICDAKTVDAVLGECAFDAVVHFAAESHVDRSILSPDAAIETNVRGTATLLAAAHRARVSRFLHVSTDEVYGDLAEPQCADEGFSLRPSSPYAASKAASDLLVLAYVRTYGLPAVITRASNNYGPYQFPEKLIPLVICKALDGQAIPVYGDGLQIRDWLYVDDHCRALLAVLLHGRDGEVYNVGGNCALTNLEVIGRILDSTGAPRTLLTTVQDRPGHDRRYALRGDKLRRETGFVAETSFDDGLRQTLAWYRNNAAWIDRVRSGEYRSYYEKNYGWRTSEQICEYS